MILRLAAMGGIMALAVLGLGGARGSLLLWETLVAAGLAAVLWRAFPSRPRRVEGLVAGSSDLLVASSRVLAPIELEVAGSCDPRLGGDPRIRARLLALLRHRAGQDAEGRHLIGAEAWRTLAEDDGVTTMEELEMIVERIERI